MLVISPNPSQDEFLLSYGGLGMHIKVAWCDPCLGSIRATSATAGRALGGIGADTFPKPLAVLQGREGLCPEPGGQRTPFAQRENGFFVILKFL